LAYSNLNTAAAFINTSSGVIYNFTAYNNGGATSFGGGPSARGGIYINLDDTTGGGWVIKNYIGQGNYPYEIWANVSGYADSTFDHNLYLHTGNGVTEASFAYVDTGGGAAVKTWPEWVALGKETSGVYGDPLLTSDYRLAAGSPAIDVGIPWQTYAERIAAGLGPVYGSGIDIGAYERKKFLFDDDEMIPKKCKSTNAACYVQP
jgi:hypothetical protein